MRATYFYNLFCAYLFIVQCSDLTKRKAKLIIVVEDMNLQRGAGTLSIYCALCSVFLDEPSRDLRVGLYAGQPHHKNIP